MRVVAERDMCGKKGGVGTYGYGECVRSVEYSLLPVSVLFSSARVRYDSRGSMCLPLRGDRWRS